MEKRKVLVTGASGFVGRAVVAALLGKGYAVRGSSRAPRNSQSADLAYVQTAPLGPDTDWQEALADVGAVVHLAARVHVMDRQEASRDEEFMLANRDGTLALAEAAARAGVTRFVFMSSVKVHGEGQARPYRESDGPVPFDAYARSKLSAELGLRQLSERTGLSIGILRPPLVYGPGVGANFLSLLRLVDKGVPLPFGAIHNRRSLVYAGNLADAATMMVGRDQPGCETFLVADREVVSTPELVRRMARALGKRARLVPVPLGLMRVAGELTGKSQQIERLTGSLHVDAGAIGMVTGWRPPYSMDQGLKDTALWYKAHKG